MNNPWTFYAYVLNIDAKEDLKRIASWIKNKLNLRIASIMCSVQPAALRFFKLGQAKNNSVKDWNIGLENLQTLKQVLQLSMTGMTETIGQMIRPIEPVAN